LTGCAIAARSDGVAVDDDEERRFMASLGIEHARDCLGHQ
jgi:hypothetical protein